MRISLVSLPLLFSAERFGESASPVTLIPLKTPAVRSDENNDIRIYNLEKNMDVKW